MALEIIIGILGMILVLIAFILDEFNLYLTRNTRGYNLLNIVGSGALVYYGLILRAWPFVILNLVWLGVAGIKLFFLCWNREKSEMKNGKRKSRQSKKTLVPSHQIT